MEIKHYGVDEIDQWLRLVARNGEILMHGESVADGKRARAAIIRAMIDVLEDAGATITWPEGTKR